MPRAGLLLLAALAAACAERPAERRNVIVYMVDTLRADALGCYGAERVQTPHIDGFAAANVRFTRAVAQSSWTRASVASVFTGTYPWTHGVRDRKDRLPESLTTVAELLRAAGYRTGGITANPNVDTHFGFEQGFEDYVGLYQWTRKAAVYKEDLIADATRVVDAVLAWLDEDDGRPFFLFVLAIDPHDPYRPPAPYDRMYDADYTGTFDGKLEAPKNAAFAARMTPRDRQYMRALYDGEVSFTDEQFGRLLRELDRRGLARDTALVLTSDHGEEFFDHGGWGHGATLFEEMVRVPLVARPPGGGPARVAEELVELRDLFALVLSWAGLDADPKLGVRDPAPCLVGRCRTREHAVAVLDLDGYFTETIQSARYKLRWYPRRQSLVLHDLEADPRELGDAARERPDVVADFGRRLDALRRDAERLAPPPPPDAPVTHHMDPQVERALRALGYLH